MRHNRFVTAFALVGVLSISLSAQENTTFTDCRQQVCSVEALEQVLFPTAAPMLTRAVNPQRTQKPPLHAPISVGLNVFFESNSDQIVPQYYTELDKVGQVLERHTDGRFHIEGHTDSIGSDAYNQALSDKRAESVKRYLAHHFSIPPERLVTKGYGKSQPRTTNETDEGRATNRRVELVRK